jgi:ABC-type bacteriocin/lantibiotic exporter with double-glycine peptidase domain
MDMQDDTTMRGLYRAVWRVTGRQQLQLILLSLTVAALAAAPLKFQQLVINNLVYGGDLRRVALLCAGLLGVVLLSAALKFALGLRLSTVGERVVLLIRERLYLNHVADATSGTGEPPKRGTLVTMLSAEAESVGSFAGAAIATPLMQVGTLVSVIGFILLSQPWLGVLALAVVLPQALVVMGIQSRINRRVRERVQALRDASDRISDSDLLRVEDEVVTDFRQVFTIRRRIFLLKLSSKLALGAISATGMVGILFLGGWLVLDGRSDVGTVVASLTGLARIEGPWRELVSFFRNASTVRVKYAMLARSIAARPAGGDPAVAAMAAQV